MTKVININTGKKTELIHFKCSICDCKFSEQEGGLQNGLIGMILFSLCPTCFSGMLDMAKHFLNIEEDE
tara:strand:+ start:837 stop:1043 length:207 start_codon:yes stop_codon:yes gene_type:complete